MTNLYINKFLYGNIAKNTFFNVSKIFFELKRIFNFYTILQQNRILLRTIYTQKNKHKNIEKLIPLIYSNVIQHVPILKQIAALGNSSYIFNNFTLESLTNMKQYYSHLVKRKNKEIFLHNKQIFLKNTKNTHNYNFFILQKNLKKTINNNYLSNNQRNPLIKALNKANYLFLSCIDSDKSPVGIPYLFLGNENSNIGIYFYTKFFLKLLQ